MFDDFDFSNTVIIGGSVLASLLPIPKDTSALPEKRNGSDDKLELDDYNKLVDKEVEAFEEEEWEYYSAEMEIPKDIADDNINRRILSDMEEEGKRKSRKVEVQEIHDPNIYYQQLSPFKNSDIDICIYGLSEEETQDKIDQIYKYLQQYTKKPVDIYLAANQVVFTAYFPFRHVQISLKYVTKKKLERK